MSNGVAFDNAPIAIDYWAQTKCRWVRYFFLSHMHSDHYQGLKPSFPHSIYCSPITKSLLRKRLDFPEDRIEEVDKGDQRSFDYKDHNGIEKYFLVTFFDANHCPGALMFLFQGSFGNIFYTADFRYDATKMEYLKIYKGSIDVLYLDNTYCDPKCEFPTREEATEEIIKLIEAHPHHVIFIVLHSLGRENLLVKIAGTCETKIVLNQQRYDTVTCLGLDMAHFSTDTHASNIRVCSMLDVKFKRSELKDQDVLFIYPTNMKLDSVHLQQNDVRYVGYSDHSCFSELDDFVIALSPRQIKPLVTRYKGIDVPGQHDRRNMEIFQKHLSRTPQEYSSRRASDDKLCSTIICTDNRNPSYFAMKNSGSYQKIKHPCKKRPRQMARGIVFQDHSDKCIDIGSAVGISSDIPLNKVKEFTVESICHIRQAHNKISRCLPATQEAPRDVSVLPSCDNLMPLPKSKITNSASEINNKTNNLMNKMPSPKNYLEESQISKSFESENNICMPSTGWLTTVDKCTDNYIPRSKHSIAINNKSFNSYYLGSADKLLERSSVVSNAKSSAFQEVSPHLKCNQRSTVKRSIVTKKQKELEMKESSAQSGEKNANTSDLQATSKKTQLEPVSMCIAMESTEMAVNMATECKSKTAEICSYQSGSIPENEGGLLCSRKHCMLKDNGRHGSRKRCSVSSDKLITTSSTCQNCVSQTPSGLRLDDIHKTEHLCSNAKLDTAVGIEVHQNTPEISDINPCVNYKIKNYNHDKSVTIKYDEENIRTIYGGTCAFAKAYLRTLGDQSCNYC